MHAKTLCEHMYITDLYIHLPYLHITGKHLKVLQK